MNITVIMSAHRTTNSTYTNMKLHSELKDLLSELGYEPIECVSLFEGAKELSFAIPTDINHEFELLDLAKDFEQDSILSLNREAMDCWLVSDRETMDYLGQWSKVSHRETKDLTAYTYFPTLNLYYTTK